MNCKRILLIRHGQTDANAAAVIQGHQQTSLNETGLQQAHELGLHLGRTGVRLSALISSDLFRALQTAEPIANACGVPIVARAQWRERSFGPWEGRALGQTDIWRMAAGEFDPPGAEPAGAFLSRVRRALLEVAAHCPGGSTVAVVTHGGPCRMVLKMLVDGELPMVPGSPKPATQRIANCSIMHLEVHTHGEQIAWRLVRMNDTDHLDAIQRTLADAG